MSVLMNTIVFEDCRNQWSVSRPLLGLILLNEKVSALPEGPSGPEDHRLAAEAWTASEALSPKDLELAEATEATCCTVGVDGSAVSQSHPHLPCHSKAILSLSSLVFSSSLFFLKIWGPQT